METKKLPLASVVITTYKRSDMLSNTIESVIQQDYKNLEILVIDDNDPASDYRQATEKVMEKYADNPIVRYIKHPENKNGAAARNTGIKNAKGMFVTYLDDDDTYRQKKVSRQVDYLLKHPQYSAVYCGWNKDGREEAPKVEGDISFEILSGELLIRTNTIMMVRETALAIGGWDENYRRNQEAAYLLRYFNHNKKIGAVPEVLVDYDTSDRGNASNPKQNEADFIYFLKDHKETINRAARNTGRNKKIIYSYRFRSIFLSYLKNKDVRNAIRIYHESMKRIPVRFNIDLVKYTISRLTR